MLKNNINNILYRVKNNSLINSIQLMQIQAENKLNPFRYYLSNEAKKRLRWLYILYYECSNNVTKSANKIGISRQWLSQIKSKFEKNNKNPRCLEPSSRAPNSTTNKQKISKETENKIIEVRKKYPCWGEKKISVILNREYQLMAGATTINRYLHKHGLINIKLSNKNKLAWKNKKEKIPQKQKMRPPKEIKDYKPGGLVEKDMKFIVKMGRFTNPLKYKAKENFWFQHTVNDSFTRIRVIGLAEDASSKTAVMVQQKAEKRLPFKIACANTDNGGENGKDFSAYLEKEQIFHFVSRAGMPTDNPRVERSHLTDEIEFYQQGNICKTFKEQEKAINAWEHTYNYIRPHQALGYLTPMKFYELWKKNPEEAYAIKNKYLAYLKKQSKRLTTSRRIKNKEQIEKLMIEIDQKLTNNLN